jgi:hypothetical protein
MDESSVRILRLPRCINPITDVHERSVLEYPSPPFFGFAPSETSVRIVRCPDCDKPVSAAHLALHRQVHESTNKQELMRAREHFQVQPDSLLEPVSPCAYSRRHAYPFQVLFEPEMRK